MSTQNKKNTIVSEETGLSLIEKSKEGFLKVIFSRLGIIILLLIVQIIVLGILFREFSEYIHLYSSIMLIISIGTVLYLLNSKLDPTVKITWLIVIMIMPIFGALLLLYTQCDIGHRLVKARLSELIKQTKDSIRQESEVLSRLETEIPEVAALTRYLLPGMILMT